MLFSISTFRCLAATALTLALACGGFGASELGVPPVENFPPSLYHRSPPTYGLAQDDTGLIYVGGFSAALVYDGTEWSDIEMPFARFVNAIICAPDGVLYAGANQQLGYFRSSRGAKKEFVSLVDRLPAAEREFGEVTAIAAASGAICFATARKILIWRDGQFTVVNHDGGRVFSAGGKIYVHRQGTPLRRLEDSALTVACADVALTQHALAFLIAEADGSLLAATVAHGFWRLQDGRAQPWPCDIDARAKQARLAHGVRLRDGTLAVAFEASGVAFLDREGRLLSFLDEASGLGNDLIHGLFEDREGGLWLTHNNGVSRSESPLATTFFDRPQGLDHGGYSLQVVRHRGTLIVSSLNGIYRLQAATEPRGAAMVRLAGSSPSARALLTHAGELFSANENALLRLESDGLVAALDFTTKSAAPPFFIVPHRRDPTRLWVGQVEGLRSVRRTEAGWKDEGLVSGISKPIIDARELPDGTLWLTKNFDGFFRVRFSPETAPVIEEFSGGRGLPAKLAANNSVVLLGDEPLIAIDYGVFRYDETRREFSPFLDFGPELNRNPLHIGRLAPSASGGLWLFAATTPPGPLELRGRRIFHVPPTGPWTQFPQLAAQRIVMPSRRGLLEEKTDGRTILWSSGTNGLLRLDVTASTRPPIPFTAVLHAEAAEIGQRWSSERLPIDVTDPRPDAGTTPPQEAEASPLLNDGKLSSSQSAVRFDFFAPRQRYGAKPHYQTWLEGYESDWTSASADRKRIFTRLPAGNYAFHVRATDADGFVSAPAVLRFQVPPPWWQAWWMITGYVLGGVSAVGSAIQWRLRAIRRRNMVLEGIVAERTKDLQLREEQLRLARDAAETANRAKSVFLANMSHELRTPLNAVLGYAQLLRRTPDLPPESGRQLEIIHQSGEHLLQMINEVLDLAKVEAGKVELHPTPLPLARFLAHFTEVFGLRASQKGLTFNLRTTGLLPEAVLADEARLRQVLYNLLSNAVKFTERGHVELAVEVAGSAEVLRFRVTDSGIGIAPGEQAAIFGPFHQAPTSPTMADQGAGLGLAISQRLVRLMGGEIVVHSSPGAGSTFEFELSLAAVPVPPPRAAGDARLLTGYHGKRRRVLIVDDEAINRDLLRALLVPLGFLVAESDDGGQVAATLTQETFDLVLLDLRLREKDGLTTTRELRAAGAAVKIIALSASVFPDDRAQALASGCDEFVAKPIDTTVLLDVIGTQLDLQWIWRTSDSRAGFAVASLPDELPAQWSLPPRPVLMRLEVLADLGDLPGLRTELAATRSLHPGAAHFLDSIDTLAARALLPKLRSWLAAALRRTS